MSETKQKNRVGRPMKFQSVEELQKKIDAYFADCDPHPEEIIIWEWHEKEETRKVKNKDGKMVDKTFKVEDRSQRPKEKKEWGVTEQQPYLITGLALALDTNRLTLVNYEDPAHYSDDIDEEIRNEFINTIKKAKSKIERFWENELRGSHPTGPIFNLKNNYDWKDRQEIDNSGNVVVRSINYRDEAPDKLKKLTHSDPPKAGKTPDKPTEKPKEDTKRDIKGCPHKRVQINKGNANQCADCGLISARLFGKGKDGNNSPA